jgi:hypothetical protein
MFKTKNPTKLNQDCLAFLDKHKVNYRQLTTTKYELYLASPIYDKVLFFPKSQKIKGMLWDNEVVKVVETQEELLEVIKSIERGMEL